MNYYNKNADEFFNGTIEVDMSSLYKEFLPFVKAAGTILDAGCGSGRDSKHFLSQGFNIHAIDASKELAKLAEKKIGIPVEVTTFQSFKSDKKFDAVWACASLLHVPMNELPSVFFNLSSYMKEDGIFYCSFKYGDDEVAREGRTFTNLNQKLLEEVLMDTELKITNCWITADVREDREDEKWINAILTKGI